MVSWNENKTILENQRKVKIGTGTAEKFNYFVATHAFCVMG